MHIVLAALFGVVTHAIKKLGPTVFVFIYVFLSHKWGDVPVRIAGQQISGHVALIAVVIAFSIFSVAFRSAVLSVGNTLDARTYPMIDQLILAKLHRFDLRIGGIRMKSRFVLEAIKNYVLYFVLALLAGLSAPILGVVILIVVATVTLVSLRDWRTGPMAEWPHVRPLLEPQNMAEIILVIGILIGFLLLLPREESVLSGTVVLLVIARFSGQIKTLARQVIFLRKMYMAARTLGTSAYRTVAPTPASPPAAGSAKARG